MDAITIQNIIISVNMIVTFLLAFISYKLSKKDKETEESKILKQQVSLLETSYAVIIIRVNNLEHQFDKIEMKIDKILEKI